MELNELIALMASSLLAGSVNSQGAHQGQIFVPTREQMRAAVHTSKELWDEVLKQESRS